MEPLETAEIGSTGLRVTGVGLGGAALGGLYSDVPEEKAIDTVVRALDLGVSYLDTAPQYGHGKERALPRPGARRSGADAVHDIDQGRQGPGAGQPAA